MELSETALGHSKLIELLQDDRMRDICCVTRGLSGSYVVAKPPFTAGLMPAPVLSTWPLPTSTFLSTVPSFMPNVQSTMSYESSIPCQPERVSPLPQPQEVWG